MDGFCRWELFGDGGAKGKRRKDGRLFDCTIAREMHDKHAEMEGKSPSTTPITPSIMIPILPTLDSCMWAARACSRAARAEPNLGLRANGECGRSGPRWPPP